MKRILATVALVMAQPLLAQAPAAPVAAPAAAAAQDQAHQELRATKDRLVAALNAKNVDALLAELDGDVRLTTMDSVLSKGPDGVKGYYQKMMVGSARLVEDMSIKADPDELSILYADNRLALTTGTALVHFRLATGKEMDVPLRWTATSVNRDGKWKIASAQFGADMFDNPVLNASQGLTKYLAGGAGLLGLLAGWLLGRRKRTA